MDLKLAFAVCLIFGYYHAAVKSADQPAPAPNSTDAAANLTQQSVTDDAAAATAKDDATPTAQCGGHAPDGGYPTK